MGRESMAEYFKTVKRLQRIGIEDPTSQIIALAGEIKQYREKIEAMNKYIKEHVGPEPSTKEQVEQLQEQNREAPKFRFTRYDPDLGRYVAPLLYKADGTVMQLCIKCSTNPLTERNRATIEAEPDLVWGDLIDVLADYENREEAQPNE